MNDNLFLLSNLSNTELLLFDQSDRLPKSLEKHDKNLYFLTNKIAESLGGSGYSVERLSVPYVPQVTGEQRLTGTLTLVICVSNFRSQLAVNLVCMFTVPQLPNAQGWLLVFFNFPLKNLVRL